MIFISHSSKNKALAAEIKAELEAAQFRCFLAHDDITVSADWHDELWQALRTSYAFVGLVTKQFNRSQFCQQELGAALALNKPRLLVRLGVRHPPGFSSRFQAVRRDRLAKALDELPQFQSLRIESWITGLASIGSWEASNALHERFREEWANMSVEKKLAWLLSAAGNGEVAGHLVGTEGQLLREPRRLALEPRLSAPFFALPLLN